MKYLLLLLLMGCSTIPYGFYRHHKTDPYCKIMYAKEINSRRVWDKKSFPLKVAIESSFYEKYGKVWEESISEWEDVTGFPIVNRDYEFYDLLTYDPKGYVLDHYIKLFVMGDSFKKLFPDLKQENNGLATVYSSSDKLQIIHNAEIVMNMDLDFSIDLEKEKMHLKSVLMHEIGHVLGLGHNHKFSSIMYPSLNKGERKTYISSEDRKNINFIYNNKDFDFKPSKKDLDFK